jgi:hypothetical protein
VLDFCKTGFLEVEAATKLTDVKILSGLEYLELGTPSPF